MQKQSWTLFLILWGGKMLLEKGKYTEKIHNLTSCQVWEYWKKQKLNMGQVATWQDRHNHYFNISETDHEPMHNYNIYMATENEKYNFMNIARAIGATVTSVSGCGTGYYIQINATDHQAEQINRKLSQEVN